MIYYIVSRKRKVWRPYYAAFNYEEALRYMSAQRYWKQEYRIEDASDSATDKPRIRY